MKTPRRTQTQVDKEDLRGKGTKNTTAVDKPKYSHEKVRNKRSSL